MKSEPPPRAASASRCAASASPLPFRALRQLIDDVEVLAARHGSVQRASARLERLENDVITLEEEVAFLKQKLDATAMETLTPLQAVEVLQRRCTCVGDVNILGALLAESLRSSGAKGASANESADVRVILSVHEVNLGASTASSGSTTADRATSSSSAQIQAPVGATIATEASRQAGRPRKRQRRESSADEAARGTTPADTAAATTESREQDQRESLISVDESDVETLPVDAIVSGTEISVAVPASESPSISIKESTSAPSTGSVPTETTTAAPDGVDASTGPSSAAGVVTASAGSVESLIASDDTDAEPTPAAAAPFPFTVPKEPGRVESRISASGVVTRNWKLPRNVLRSINTTRRTRPALTIESLQQLDSARPWDLVFFRRSNVSYIFHYRLLKSKGKRWVRAARWFQFQFRRELWEWMHWIKMDERRDSPEWELYRRSRDERSVSMLTAWWKLHDNAMDLIADDVLPADVWLDPAIWFMRPEQRLIWNLATKNPVKEQAQEDLNHPVRCYFVSRRYDHPFFGSEFQAMYPEKHNLPLLISADRQHEVQIAPPSSCSSDATAAAASIPCPTPWGTIEEAPRYRVVRHHHRPRDTTARVHPPPPEVADFSA